MAGLQPENPLAVTGTRAAHPRLVEFLAGRLDTLSVEEAALHLAELDHAPVDHTGCLTRLKNLADRVATMLPPDLPPGVGGPEFLSAANAVLFRQEGLVGDRETYYDPANSCLDHVLVRRKGLPITLSVVYLAVARRLRRPIVGVALPAHFFCRYDDGVVRVYIDVFDGGRLLTEEDVQETLITLTGKPLEPRAPAWEAATPRQILHRMVSNLKNSWLLQGRKAEASALDALQSNTLANGLSL
jgi:regulator of sirC expression with transglutaminase-like and TPR domain